ncbi:sigma-70 family RNA polymerase sigma factor [Brevibacterium sp. UCMA 11754]|uniref:sigma-70 family RNA polymerase sigma factor n=1 Tax=Brevibacterium sp. UCMA 11754 TaxID=2749198 RepID=UPI001F2080D3|nr:sigma-70 family RNA polymerase sigma factor [Brevibacterium sp. UCMA 11754]
MFVSARSGLHPDDAARRRKVTAIEESLLASDFEIHRPRVTALASKVLGSGTDAEDAVQEAWIRLDRQDPEDIDNLGGWLTRVVGRICLDVLRRRTTRGESSLDSWISEAVITDDNDDPESTAVRSDSLGPAMMIVLDSLQPEERFAFVLHDLFAVPFVEISTIIGRSSAAAKMAASRARRKIKDVPAPSGDLTKRRAAVDAFLIAAREGDFDALLHVLDPNVTWHRCTAHGHTVQLGANDVLAAVRRGDPERIEARRVGVNGEPGILVSTASGRTLGLMACTVADGKLIEIVSIIAYRQLDHLALPPRRTPPGTHLK